MDALDTYATDAPEARVARRIAESAPGEARDAEAELYRLLAPRAWRLGLRHRRDGHAAADLMQQVMTLTIEQLRSGRMREEVTLLSVQSAATHEPGRYTFRHRPWPDA